MVLPIYQMSKGKSASSSLGKSREKVHAGVNKFVRGIKFSNYVNAGMAPEEAARRVGISLKFGHTLNNNQITKLKESGEFDKRKRY